MVFPSRSPWLLACVAALAAGALACSGSVTVLGGDGGSSSSGGGSSGSGGSSSGGGGSSTGSGGSSSGSGGSCLASSTTSACYSCIQTNCAGQLDAFFNGCSGYVACVCPGGAYSPCAVQSQMCQSLATSSQCQTAEQAVARCIQPTCLNACQNSTSGSSSGGCTGGSSSSGGSTVTCADLSSCCSTLPSSEQSGCISVASGGNQSACSAAFTGYHCP